MNRSVAALVVLSNAGTTAGADDIGRHLLDPQSPLLAQSSPLVTPPKTRTGVAVASTLYDGTSPLSVRADHLSDGDAH